MIPFRYTMPPINVSLESAYNALNSLALLDDAETQSGLNVWVRRTAEALRPEERQRNRLIFKGLREALLLPGAFTTFPDYLAALANEESAALRERLLERVGRAAAVHAPTPENFYSALQQGRVWAYRMGIERMRPDVPRDDTFWSEVGVFLEDPDELQRLLVSHLEHMWQTTLAREWQRVERILRHHVLALDYSLPSEGVVAEAFYYLSGRDLPPEIGPRAQNEVEHVIFIPSWHNGRTITQWESEGELRIFFSEPPNYDIAALRSTRFRGRELVTRLNALADEVRLRIIELLAQNDEMSGQEITAALGLSQSNVSRHLRQLVVSGYLYERRGVNAVKTYRLSSYHFERTFQAIKHLLNGGRLLDRDEAEMNAYPSEVRNFLDRQGRLETWPARQKDKLFVLNYLTEKFEPNRVYSEKEVDELLQRHMIYKDYVTVRRALCDYGFLERERDGSRYWRAPEEQGEPQ